MIHTIGVLRYIGQTRINLNLHDGLGKYLRRLFAMHRHNVEKIGAPMHRCHVTVVARESLDTVRWELWGKYEGREVEFDLVLEPATNGNAYWMPVRSEWLEMVREELGLSRERSVPFHFGFGYLRAGRRVPDGVVLTGKCETK